MLRGTHEAGYAPLARAFEEVLKQTPQGGAALCVYQDGRPVFDMWGGVRDRLGNPWEERTPSVSFSTTKGVAATALHMLRDRGLVDYDEKVATYWPAFAQNGKGAITVRQVLNHSAGMYGARSLVGHADVLLDWDATISALERAPAAHAAGRFHAYHAMTHGHLVGELVQRVSQRPFSAFVADEIARPLGLSDFLVGAPDDAIARAARLIIPERAPAHADQTRRARERQRAPKLGLVQSALRLFGVPMSMDRVRDAFAPRGIGKWDFSSPEVLRAVIPSANGLFSARDLARMYAALAHGGSLDGVRLMSPETVREASRVEARGPDGVLVFPMGWRLGYHGIASSLGLIKGAFGHFGYGGSGAWASPRHNASFAFVVNIGSGTPVGDLRIVKLSGAAVQCIRARRRRHVA